MIFLLLLKLNCILFAFGQEISNAKCEEFSKAVYQEIGEIDPSSPTGKRLRVSTCGIYQVLRIVGGSIAVDREFPHMAVIGYGLTEDESKLDWFCGGSLISEKHVLTAAHCAMSLSGPPQKVKLGVLDRNINDEKVQTVKVDKVLIHPEYKRPVKYHDIAILFLLENVIFTAYVRPACLNTDEEFSNKRATASGYGKTATEALETNNLLLKVDLNIIPITNCSKYLNFRKYEMPQGIIKGMICAGDLNGGHDTCQGDSGGPLQNDASLYNKSLTRRPRVRKETKNPTRPGKRHTKIVTTEKTALQETPTVNVEHSNDLNMVNSDCNDDNNDNFFFQELGSSKGTLVCENQNTDTVSLQNFPKVSQKLASES